NYFQYNQFTYNNSVVVDALLNFNQCLEIENKGLRLNYQEQAPRSVLIFGELTNTVVRPKLDVVEYDTQKLSCTSPDFNKERRSQKVGPGDPSRDIISNFTITCVRTPAIEQKATYFPPVKVAISTSLGPYTVALPEDTLNGFFLASEAKAQYDKVVQEKDS